MGFPSRNELNSRIFGYSSNDSLADHNSKHEKRTRHFSDDSVVYQESNAVNRGVSSLASGMSVGTTIASSLLDPQVEGRMSTTDMLIQADITSTETMIKMNQLQNARERSANFGRRSSTDFDY